MVIRHIAVVTPVTRGSESIVIMGRLFEGISDVHTNTISWLDGPRRGNFKGFSPPISLVRLPFANPIFTPIFSHFGSDSVVIYKLPHLIVTTSQRQVVVVVKFET